MYRHKILCCFKGQPEFTRINHPGILDSNRTIFVNLRVLLFRSIVLWSLLQLKLKPIEKKLIKVDNTKSGAHVVTSMYLRSWPHNIVNALALGLVYDIVINFIEIRIFGDEAESKDFSTNNEEYHKVPKDQQAAIN